MRRRRFNVEKIVDSICTIGNELERIAKDNGIELIVHSNNDSEPCDDFCTNLQIESIIRKRRNNGDTSFDDVINIVTLCDDDVKYADSIIAERAKLYTNEKLFNLKEKIYIDKNPFKLIIVTYIENTGYIKHIPIGVGIKRSIKNQLNKTVINNTSSSLLKMLEICMVYCHMVMNEFCNMIEYMNSYVYNSYIEGISQNITAAYYLFYDGDDWDAVTRYINNIPFYSKAFNKLCKTYPITRDEFADVLKSVDEFINS